MEWSDAVIAHELTTRRQLRPNAPIEELVQDLIEWLVSTFSDGDSTHPFHPIYQQGFDFGEETGYEEGWREGYREAEAEFGKDEE
jgi:hypothetical protein